MQGTKRDACGCGMAVHDIFWGIIYYIENFKRMLHYVIRCDIMNIIHDGRGYYYKYIAHEVRC